jgi:NADH:ubiquinone oxidoreductase subunit 6 (subunit J)
MNGLGLEDPFVTVVASIAFWIAAIGSTIAAFLMVMVVKNLIRAAVALTAVLASVAAIYAVLGADFLALVQLVVYIGAIAILIMFAIFMTPGQVDAPGIVDSGQKAAAFLVALAVLVVSGIAIMSHDWNVIAQPLDIPTTQAIGGLMLTRYVLPFEIVAVLLSVSLIGAIVIARED